MLNYTDLKKGVVFVRDGEPFEVLDSNFSRMQQRKAVIQAKIRNLITGKVTDTTFQASDQYQEANIEKRPLKYLYEYRGEYVFIDPADQKKRITLSDELLGDAKKWLLPNTEVIALMFDEQIIKINLPIKMDIKVIEAPPGVHGDRAQSGSKAIKLETGAMIQAPLFINTDDIVRVNTETGDYVERTEKA